MPTSTIELPEDLASRIEDRLEYTDFDSVDEYVEFLTREVLGIVEAEAETGGETIDERESEVRSRLRSLGYIE
ncbi:hypothetical protein [Halorhabdus sp. CUG00001]|uniref:hypothetical protein n=1 Tax=Halorhabdus sp. CUG00001 TaxID=2600297 RepID=UPI00131B9828|nr:hypothetical protein [Halorhabdus sp. CUG00001]